MEPVEKILSNGQPLAYIIRGEVEPMETAFFTPPEFKQQVGYIVCAAGREIPRHFHRPIERCLTGTSEVVIVRRGHCHMDIYNDAQELVASHELLPGDIAVMVSGGHGFRMHEDTVLLEVKQGPYTGIDEKERF